MPRTVNNLFTTHGKDILRVLVLKRVNRGDARHRVVRDESGNPCIDHFRATSTPAAYSVQSPRTVPTSGPSACGIPRRGKGVHPYEFLLDCFLVETSILQIH